VILHCNNKNKNSKKKPANAGFFIVCALGKTRQKKHKKCREKNLADCKKILAKMKFALHNF
jgi:hypothetical protein